MTPHTCDGCEALPKACKTRLLKRAERAEGLLRDDVSEPGAYWRRAWEVRGGHLDRATTQLHRQQQRADRLESALRKAERTLERYERWAPLAPDDSDPEGRADDDLEPSVSGP